MARRTTKRRFTSLTLREALRLFQRESFTEWLLNAPPLPPSSVWPEIMRRLGSFGIEGSEDGKLTLIDAIFGEVLPRHPKLRIWKTAALSTDTLTGFADYLLAPRRAFIEGPLLCAVEAKRDNFEAGEIQCVAEMYACQWINQKDGFEQDVYGIVTNGKGWQFYKTDETGDVYSTELVGIHNLPELLGAIEAVCAACAALVGGK